MSERNPSSDEEIEIDLDASIVQPPPPPAAPRPGPVASIVTGAEAVTAARATPSGGVTMAQPLGEAEAQGLVAMLEREARALGSDPAAARLHYEMGLLWEEPLKQPRNAAVCYQNAYRLNPKYLPNLRAARRLFSDVGNWQMVAQLLDAEAAIAPGGAGQLDEQVAALLFEKALLLDERLGRADEALALLQRCHERFPDDPGVLVQLEAAWAARSDWARLKEVQEKLAQVVDDPAVQAHYLASAAHLCETRLQAGAEAQALYRRAFALDHEDPVLLSAIKRAAERENDSEELLAALGAEARAAGAAAGPIYYRIARVCERLGKSAEALEALLAGRKVAPDDSLILAELAQRYEGAGDWEALAEVLRIRAKSTSDQNELIALNLRLGALCDEKLQREDESIACYRRVRELAPANAAAIAALGKLCHRKQDWEGLLETYEAEIASAEDPRLKAGRMYKSAELLESKLGRDEQAIARYREILDVVPGYLPATRALTRIYERTERYQELVAMYELELTQTRDRDQLIALLSRVALVYEERLKDLEGAAGALRRILDVAQDHLPTIRNLARVCERAGMWEELIRTNDLEASFAGDSKQVISLLHRNAEIYEEQLKTKDKAIEAYQKVLALSPSYLPCLKALGRLYAQTGRWSELVEMYRQEAEVVPSTEQAAGLIFKMGELYEEKLKDLDQAISAWQEVLTLSPAHFPALRALSRVYRAQKAWESLVEVLRAEAAARTDAAEKAHALFQVGALWEDELGNVAMAIESYREVLQHVRGHVPAIRALERLFASQENHRELVSLYELEVELATAPEARLSAQSKLARLYRERLNDPARAAACYEAVLAASPENLWALKGLEQLKASDPAARVELRARLAGRRSDARLSAALLLAQAMDRTRSGLAGALDDLRAAAALRPDDLRTQAALERALRQANDSAGLASLYERQLGSASDAEARVSLLLRLASLYEQALGRPDRALAAFKAVLELEPANLIALRGTRRLLARTGQHAEVFRLLRLEANGCRDPKTAIELLLEAGRLATEKLDDFEGARGALQAALERDPLEPRATQLLEDLLASRGGAADLAALHLKRAQSRGAAGDAAAAAEELVSAAQVFAGKLNAPADAIGALDRALTLVPTHVAALQLRGELSWATGRWAEAAQAWSRRIEQGGDPREIAVLHHRLGAIFQLHLNDPSRAVAHLLTSLSVEPRNLDALERVAALQLAARNWQGAADALRRAIELERDPQKLAAHLVEFARVAEEGFGDAAAAAAQYKRALDLSPGDGTILDKLAGLYERLGNLPELVSLLEQQSVTAAAGGDKQRAVALRLKTGELHAKLGDQIKAVQAYRFAVELQPDGLAARIALADLLARDGNAVAAAMEEHRNLLKLDPLRMESYHVLYRLYSGARQLDRAVCTGHVLSFFRAMNEVELASFSEAKGRVPQETSESLSEADIATLLYHPAARHPLTEVMRIVGDQLVKVYEPQLEAQGLGKSDRLKSDHAIYKLVKTLASVFGVEKFDVYMGKRGAQVTTENTDPLSVIVGPDLVRRFNAREQRFLFGRAMFDLRNKLALARRLEAQQLGDLLGNTIRVAAPGFDRLGRADPEASKRIRKAMSGKSIKQLEQLVPELNATKSFDLPSWLNGLALSADRAGLLLAGDIGAVLQMLFREDPSVSGMRVDSTEQLTAAVRKRRDFAELLVFVLSDDYAKLRGRLKLGL